jgi:hypothetical protein
MRIRYAGAANCRGSDSSEFFKTEKSLQAVRPISEMDIALTGKIQIWNRAELSREESIFVFASRWR